MPGDDTNTGCHSCSSSSSGSALSHVLDSTSVVTLHLYCPTPPGRTTHQPTQATTLCYSTLSTQSALCHAAQHIYVHMWLLFTTDICCLAMLQHRRRRLRCSSIAAELQLFNLLTSTLLHLYQTATPWFCRSQLLAALPLSSLPRCPARLC
jgi:hypothetical protein